MAASIYLALVAIFWSVSSSLGDISVISKNGTETLTFFYDMMANFGPDLPDGQIQGYVYNVQPFNACNQVAPPPDNTTVWIALIARDNCTFVEKVLNVQKWFAAAIVYNRINDNDVEKMNGDGKGVTIPSVFVGWSDGMMLRKDYCYNCTTLQPEIGYYEVKIDDREHMINPYLLWPFLVVVGTCFVLMLVFMAVKWCRDFRKRRKSRLSAKHLKKIPTKKFKKGDEYDVCAICLDDYEEGDKLRLLPCSHVYHTKCIDPWLTKNKRSCPICKRKVIPGDDPDDESDSDSSEDGDGATERTPLLGATAAGSSAGNRRSTFDNSGLPEAFRQPPVSNVTEGEDHETGSSDDSSDEELGAVGGARQVKLARENQLLPMGGTERAEIANEINVQSASEGSVRDETIVIEARKGADNLGYVVDGEGEESDEELSFPDCDVVYSEASKRDEKKSNGVV